MLIAIAFPVMQVYVRKGHNAISCKKHLLTLPHNFQTLTNILPLCPQKLPVIVFVVKVRTNIDSFFKTW